MSRIANKNTFFDTKKKKNLSENTKYEIGQRIGKREDVFRIRIV